MHDEHRAGGVVPLNGLHPSVRELVVAHLRRAATQAVSEMVTRQIAAARASLADDLASVSADVDALAAFLNARSASPDVGIAVGDFGLCDTIDEALAVLSSIVDRAKVDVRLVVDRIADGQGATTEQREWLQDLQAAAMDEVRAAVAKELMTSGRWPRQVTH